MVKLSRAFFLCILIGCNQASSTGTPNVSSDADKLKAAATEKLKVALDGWQFGESDEQIRQRNPGVYVIQMGDLLVRQSVLSRYDIDAGRPDTGTCDDGSRIDGYEFMVTLFFTNKAGQEVKQPWRYGVHESCNGDGTWVVSGASREEMQ